MFVSAHRLRQCSAGFGLTLAARCPKTRLRRLRHGRGRTTPNERRRRRLSPLTPSFTVPHDDSRLSLPVRSGHEPFSPSQLYNLTLSVPPHYSPVIPRYQLINTPTLPSNQITTAPARVAHLPLAQHTHCACLTCRLAKAQRLPAPRAVSTASRAHRSPDRRTTTTANSRSADRGVAATTTTMPRKAPQVRCLTKTLPSQRAVPTQPTMPEPRLGLAVERGTRAASLRTIAHSRPELLKPP
jgi:hypothetical protein